ncbi:hypothetical protein [Acidovorax sp. BLS4]|uniref:hypothetical protein n=1 Tax=Acidovorax sp. BLS4 TaxID=3273430 RepID=UPI002941CC77|nr:hypothetical protein [Paracidovorax avenae]WOI45348.1 hypothetical protein R1Z03_23000 [Paracidovorax avenae]
MEYHDICALFTKTGISDAMADQKITTIDNGAGVNATLNSVHYPGDHCNLPNRRVTHTGSSDGDCIRVRAITKDPAGALTVAWSPS